MIGMDLLGIEDLERADIERILHTAEHMREIGNREVKKVPTLRGRTVVNLFFESSTRTRSSFEIAAKRLSADVVNFSPSSSSMKKSESILDTARNLDAMDPDAVVVRHAVAGVPKRIAEVLDVPVINAGDGAHDPAGQEAHADAPEEDRGAGGGHDQQAEDDEHAGQLDGARHHDSEARVEDEIQQLVPRSRQGVAPAPFRDREELTAQQVVEQRHGAEEKQHQRHDDGADRIDVADRI